MRAEMVPGGYLVPGGRSLFMELQDLESMMQWMSAEPVTPEEYERLEPGEHYRKFGTAKASMDSAIFQCSPNGEGKPVREAIVAGRRFINVAAAGEIHFAQEPDGFSTVEVNKTHVLGFAAGRTVKFMVLDDKWFVETVGTPDNDSNLKLPQGATITSILLDEDWIVRLPTPTSTFWWFGQGRGFQGPINPPQ